MRIAHFTGFSKKEIETWTQQELIDAINLIQRYQQDQNSVLISLVEYYLLRKANPTKKGSKGKIESDASEKSRLEKKAAEIREFLTGKKPERKSNINKLQDAGFARGYRVKHTMTLEEFFKKKGIKQTKPESPSV